MQRSPEEQMQHLKDVVSQQTGLSLDQVHLQEQMQHLEDVVSGYLQAHQTLVELENQVEMARFQLKAADRALTVCMPFDVEAQIYVHYHLNGTTTVFKINGEASGNGNDCHLLPSTTTYAAIMGDGIAEAFVEGLTGGTSPGAVLLQQILQDSPAQKQLDELIG